MKDKYTKVCDALNVYDEKIKDILYNAIAEYNTKALDAFSELNKVIESNYKHTIPLSMAEKILAMVKE